MAKKNSWYAWRDGTGNGGVCKSWDECQQASSGKSGEKHKGFQTYEEAWSFAFPGQPLPDVSDVKTEENNQEEITPEMPKPVAADPTQKKTAETRILPALDMSRAEKGSVSERVDQFCKQYGYDHLSEDQKRAVQAVKGKYLLFAVPGSGKTTVIMARTGYLIHGCGIDPKKLMTMTFTRASAKEMHDRFCKKFVKEGNENSEDSIPDFRTIHSFCYSIVIPLLRRKGFRCPSHVINEDLKDKTRPKKRYMQRLILRNVLHECNLPADKCADETVQDAFQTAFSSIKNREMTEKEYSRYSVKVGKTKYLLAPVYEKYQRALCELDCMDFDDMLIFALQGLREKPDALAELRGRYEYWSVDEAQDNSRIQHELMLLLTGPNGNLFMVGDDDQSIYSFRGAEPGLLLEYGRQTDVHLLVMGTNYRSDSDIVVTSKRFVESNMCRADKQMKASHTDHGLIGVLPGFGTEAKQYSYIDSVAEECRKSGKKLGVLYQLNVSALPLVVHMHRAGIPFESSKGLADLLRGKVAGSIIQILRLAMNPNSMEKFLESKKSLGLHWVNEERTEELKRVHGQNRQKSVLQILLELQEKEDTRVEKLRMTISALKEIPTLTPAEAAWKTERSFLGLSFETLTERLAFYAVLSVCDLYYSIEEMLNDLDRMMRAERKKDRDADEEESDEPEEEESEVITEGEPVVTLSTIHSAKGREWDHVIIVDSFDETFPGKPQPERIGYDPEEPRRVFYVAATRAIHQLDILTVEFWHGNIECVSPFVPEYAWIADQFTEKPVSESVSPGESVVSSFEQKLVPGLYYGVPVGRNPGVYSNYSDAFEQVDHFPVPGDMQLKKFATYEEAWAYTFPGVDMPDQKFRLQKNSIDNVIQLSGGVVFNKPINLPDEVIQGLLEYLGTSSLKSLPADRISQMKKQSDLFGKGTHAVYHGHTAGYSAVYMPVNFYKIWLPLWKLLDKNKLPVQANVLELGPGPGTSTWSLITLYKWLAAENPDHKFSLQYTAVELETDFREVFDSIRIRMEQNMPANLIVELTLVSGQNAFEYIEAAYEKSVDLLIESNLLNENENRSDETVAAYLNGMGKILKKDAHAIMIEPGTGEQLLFMGKLSESAKYVAYCDPCVDADLSCVYLAGNALVEDAMDIGLRYSRKMEHWFSYLILERA